MDVLSVGGFTENDHAVGILGVEVVEKALGGERLVDTVPDRVAEFTLGHPTVDGQGGDQVHVIDTGVGRQV